LQICLYKQKINYCKYAYTNKKLIIANMLIQTKN